MTSEIHKYSKISNQILPFLLLLQKKLITIFKTAITLKTTLHLSTPNLKHNQPSKKIFKKTDKLHDSNNPIPTCKKALVKNACTKIIVQTVEIA